MMIRDRRKIFKQLSGYSSYKMVRASFMWLLLETRSALHGESSSILCLTVTLKGQIPVLERSFHTSDSSYQVMFH